MIGLGDQRDFTRIPGPDFRQLYHRHTVRILYGSEGEGGQVFRLDEPAVGVDVDGHGRDGFAARHLFISSKAVHNVRVAVEAAIAIRLFLGV